LILLVLVFGTILAAGLPLILGAAAVVVSLAGIYLLAQRVETSIFAMNTASMIGLGLGIDFSLLIVSRFREELDRGLSSRQATINTVATSGRSIVFSGLTVMLGLSVVCLYDLVLIRSIAMGMRIGAGEATPVQVLIKARRDDGAFDPTMLEGVYQLVKRVETDPRVQRVDSLVSLTPPNTPEAQFKGLTAAQFLTNPQTAPFIPLFVNVKRPNDPVDHRADIQYVAIFSRQGEIHQDTIDLVKDL